MEANIKHIKCFRSFLEEKMHIIFWNLLRSVTITTNSNRNISVWHSLNCFKIQINCKCDKTFAINFLLRTWIFEFYQIGFLIGHLHNIY